MQGHFTLMSPEDLRAKLQRDFHKFKASPLDVDAAFNFFVTAEHMPDWVFPSMKRNDANSGEQAKIRSDPIPSICSHIANGAKHFEATATRHKSVNKTGIEHEGGYFGNYFGAYFGDYFGGENVLMIHLQPDAAKKANIAGQTIPAIDLAEKVLDFWNKHPLK